MCKIDGLWEASSQSIGTKRALSKFKAILSNNQYKAVIKAELSNLVIIG